MPQGHAASAGQVSEQHRQADHGKFKQLLRPVRGFKSMKTAYATIKGFEVMRALRKGQAAIFNLTRDILGGARLVAWWSAPSASAHTRWPRLSIRR